MMVYQKGKYLVIIHELTTRVGFYPVVFDEASQNVFTELASDTEEEAIQDAETWINAQETPAHPH